MPSAISGALSARDTTCEPSSPAPSHRVSHTVGQDGRVARGAVLDRLRLFAGTNDGFALAEADLLARGTGQLFGERQSGLGDLQVASLLRDRELLEEARLEARAVLEAGDAMATIGSIPWLLHAAEERFGKKIRWLERV